MPDECGDWAAGEGAAPGHSPRILGFGLLTHSSQGQQGPGGDSCHLRRDKWAAESVGAGHPSSGALESNTCDVDSEPGKGGSLQSTERMRAPKSRQYR